MFIKYLYRTKKDIAPKLVLLGFPTIVLFTEIDL